MLAALQAGRERVRASLPWLHPLREPLRVISLPSWAMTMLWLVPLLAAEACWCGR